MRCLQAAQKWLCPPEECPLHPRSASAKTPPHAGASNVLRRKREGGKDGGRETNICGISALCLAPRDGQPCISPSQHGGHCGSQGLHVTLPCSGYRPRQVSPTDSHSETKAVRLQLPVPLSPQALSTQPWACERRGKTHPSAYTQRGGSKARPGESRPRGRLLPGSHLFPWTGARVRC